MSSNSSPGPGCDQHTAPIQPRPPSPCLAPRGLAALVVRARLALLPVLPCLALACAAAGPIPPVAVAGTGEQGASPHGDFDADQRERLEVLHAMLADVEADDPGSLLVRLAFEDAVDLDLFVTDPLQESVYFANSPSRSGGRLLADRRCDDVAPPIETVHFVRAMAGRYRVGVDHHARCDRRRAGRAAGKQALYVVRVDVEGRVLRREGAVTPGRFEVIVLEFEVGDAGEAGDAPTGADD